jgi:amino acid transporter
MKMNKFILENKINYMAKNSNNKTKEEIKLEHKEMLSLLQTLTTSIIPLVTSLLLVWITQPVESKFISAEFLVGVISVMLLIPLITILYMFWKKFPEMRRELRKAKKGQVQIAVIVFLILLFIFMLLLISGYLR